MKKILIILLLCFVSVFGWGVTYFGYCDSAGNGIGSTNVYLILFIYEVGGYTCPGSGNQNITELGIESYDDVGATFRLGLYTTSGDLVVETSSAKNDAYPAAWVTWNSGELTWHIGTKLTGGTTYLFAVGADGTHRVVGDNVSSGDTKSKNTDYSGGMPDPLPSVSDSDTWGNIRCGVESAVGGLKITVFTQLFLNIWPSLVPMIWFVLVAWFCLGVRIVNKL